MVPLKYTTRQDETDHHQGYDTGKRPPACQPTDLAPSSYLIAGWRLEAGGTHSSDDIAAATVHVCRH